MNKVTVLLGAVCALGAQTFETASIKPADPDKCQGSMMGPMTGGGLRAECVPLKALVTWAYQLQNYQLTGGPSWIESDSWTILAKPAPGDVTGDIAIEYEKMTDAQRANTMVLVRKRLQALLAERFQLKVRRETRDQAVFTLTAGKAGPKLVESEDQSKAGSIFRRQGKLTSKGATMTQATQFLSGILGRPVIDRTGLTAHYDFELTWTPERHEAGDSEQGPTIFTTIQEQLGLKLEPSKAPVEMLVIEGVEKPSEN